MLMPSAHPFHAFAHAFDSVVLRALGLSRSGVKAASIVADGAVELIAGVDQLDLDAIEDARAVPRCRPPLVSPSIARGPASRAR